ncbi:hypothetical protein OAB10_05120 [Candidatus Pelagibacter sp.]|nr:hypothetical protein [Candidatus Pelagibacter sp.]|tara:strand:- start:18 stop:293 length:276 start_codon:yes stop_codon:yes gene_type:complete
MNKLLGIIVLGLLWCNVGFARISIFSEDSGYSGSFDWFAELIAAVIVLVPFFGAVWYSTYKENKEWEEAQQRSMNLHRPKYKKRKKRKNKK